jgi:hypothetical protein
MSIKSRDNEETSGHSGDAMQISAPGENGQQDAKALRPSMSGTNVDLRSRLYTEHMEVIRGPNRDGQSKEIGKGIKRIESVRCVICAVNSIYNLHFGFNLFSIVTVICPMEKGMLTFCGGRETFTQRCMSLLYGKSNVFTDCIAFGMQAPDLRQKPEEGLPKVTIGVCGAFLCLSIYFAVPSLLLTKQAYRPIERLERNEKVWLFACSYGQKSKF